ncbi:nascent polypeptide-associated complex protein [Candidatus Pacearchaeota archaeon]|nr:nascent polypeptide-associated complex protein [Candidatus Pacearchaeota archaeon]
MFPGLNPKKMQHIMKQMGMDQEEIDASKVIIEKVDGKIIIDNPSVIKISIHGQDTFQVSGESREENSAPEISKDDTKTIIEKTGCTKEQAKETLKQTKDLAEAILKLSE